MLDTEIEAPEGFILFPEQDWLTIANLKMYGPGQRVAKLVHTDEHGWVIQLFKGRPVSIANLRILQPWVDSLNA